MSKSVNVTYVGPRGENGFSFNLADFDPAMDASVRRLLERLAKGVLSGGISKVTVEAKHE
jgi:hypothetical protein